MTERTPARPSVSRPSGMGKNASEAEAAPPVRSPALATASSEDSTRDIWPAPTPTAMPSRTMTTALDLTCRQTRQAISRSSTYAALRRIRDQHPDPRLLGELRGGVVIQPRAHDGFQERLGERGGRRMIERA